MTVKEILEFDISNEFIFDSEEDKQQFLEEFGAIFLDSLTERLLPLMDEPTKIKFAEILDAEDADENTVFTFFAEVMPTFPEILGDELIRTKQEAINLLALTK